MPIYINNGKPDTNYSGGVVQDQRLRSLAYYGGVPTVYAQIRDIPIAPIKGVYTFQVKPAGTESSHLTVSLDRNHYIPAAPPWMEQPDTNGPVLFDKGGDFRSNYVPVTVNTRLLANGWHSLAVKSTGVTGDTSYCSYCKPNVISKTQAVAKIWFYVNN